ncbi:hypothetical protein B0H63DRAFT_504298 [Podospora didyma]|uniref:Uncharacterized protein n=1 Tax=Podospora didyma TaxID=330526 RepID=A0AAE0N2F7_9PEZI|nr:hypothetical protein B0H63DRAFT_504298 [Podospora didyma]
MTQQMQMMQKDAAARAGHLTSQTAGAPPPGYLQANLIVLRAQYAADFRDLWTRNPVLCPLLTESSTPAPPTISPATQAIGLRTDAPRYRIYRDGFLSEDQPTDLHSVWDSSSHVGFLNRNVSMCCTTLPLAPAGVFVKDMAKIRGITRRFRVTHGEPVAWGDIEKPDMCRFFGGCGVTPQEAVVRAGAGLKGMVMVHAPGHMIVLDVMDEEVFPEGEKEG